MAAIVSDTSPLNYLVLIGAIDILPRIFSEVIIPQAVADELSRDKTPEAVREWFAHAPAWIVRRTPVITEATMKLDPGETEAILLAHELGIRDLLLDDNAARREALKQGLTVFGTLGILVTASRRQWIEFDEYIKRLENTNFHAHERLIADARRQIDTA